jgi:hypothetical protein
MGALSAGDWLRARITADAEVALKPSRMSRRIRRDG